MDRNARPVEVDLRNQRQYLRAEAMILDHLRRPANSQQKQWLTNLLYRHYEYAIVAKATVAIGSWTELYKDITPKLAVET